MKLTQSHIKELYNFTRKHYVEYYDVQTELVDHLANDIEQILEEKPKLTFEQARDKSFKKFGVFGFMTVVEQKQNQMTKKYFKTILSFAKEWFRLPKIILTILIAFAFYYIQEIPKAYFIYASIYGIIIFLEVFILFRNKRKSNKQFKETGKKWMFQNIIQINGIGASALIMFYIFDYSIPNNAKDFLFMGDFRRFFSALLISAVVILGYITLIVIPQKAEELLEETYPEYKLSKTL
ncbi:MAG: hypothetical protein ABJH82_10085 [Polaribacter sp.]|uniref:hypothetical protein n=1 Tax=Polaribacter sp. TaxID=1920175 RepID=UPI003262FACB